MRRKKSNTKVIFLVYFSKIKNQISIIIANKFSLEEIHVKVIFMQKLTRRMNLKK